METTRQPQNGAFITSPIRRPVYQPCSDSWTINFTPRTYKEEIEEKGMGPKKRGLDLVSHLLSLSAMLDLRLKARFLAISNPSLK
jgi:hypothetical protein